MLAGCAEPLQTGRPPTLEPSPSLPGTTPATLVNPTPETAEVTPLTDESVPATPVVDTQPPTQVFTATAALPLPSPTVGVTIVPPTLPALSNEERWRAEQAEREIFATPRRFITSGSQLWWYDPVYQQHVRLGNFTGPFVAQAQFQLVKEGGASALEVPYEINQSYGLTALSPALVERMRNAGYEQWVETYVVLSPAVAALDGDG